MEDAEVPSTSKQDSGEIKSGDYEITSNWKIVNDKLLHNTISTVDVTRSPGRADLEDVVCLETCIRLEGDASEKKEPCNITIKLKNGQKIARIAIVSEAFLIELYKLFGEYVTTVHAEFIDEFEQSVVYFADVSLATPTPEVTVKFARMKNPGAPMWLYGIRLSLTQDVSKGKKSEEFDYNVIGELLQSKEGKESKPADWASKILEKSEGGKNSRNGNHDLDSFMRDFMTINTDSSKHFSARSGEKNRTASRKEMIVEYVGDSKDICQSDFKTYIDDRLRQMEDRLSQRIDAMNLKTNEKLDRIIKLINDRSK